MKYTYTYMAERGRGPLLFIHRHVYRVVAAAPRKPPAAFDRADLALRCTARCRQQPPTPCPAGAHVNHCRTACCRTMPTAGPDDTLGLVTDSVLCVWVRNSSSYYFRCGRSAGRPCEWLPSNSTPWRPAPRQPRRNIPVPRPPEQVADPGSRIPDPGRDPGSPDPGRDPGSPDPDAS